MSASQWKNWIGPVERAEDRLSAGLARRWRATFDLPAAPHDAPLPQGVHFCLCPPDAPTAMLGEDGHPQRDDAAVSSFLPPVPLPRRMWAGSSIAFDAPLRAGATIERTSRIVRIVEKRGSSGPLVFVDVLHTLTADGEAAVRETQTLVYREAATADASLTPPAAGPGQFDPAEWKAQRALVPDPRLLFRYSALTFNTHRIHYDLPYAREVERYRGLVVHGPLLASLLLQLVAARHGDNALAEFAFTGLSPAIAGEPLHLVLREEAGGDIALGAFAQDGRQITRASARLA